ncbi:MAG: hypothetical protein NT096_00240 [Proteobacteria bacterium]|nr:hypothetical protein [Pseudomonadota bacterium]
MDDVTTIIEKIKTLEGEELLKYWVAIIKERKTPGAAVSGDPNLAFYKNEIPSEVKEILVDKLHLLTKSVGVDEFIEMLH